MLGLKEERINYWQSKYFSDLEDIIKIPFLAYRG